MTWNPEQHQKLIKEAAHCTSTEALTMSKKSVLHALMWKYLPVIAKRMTVLEQYIFQHQKGQIPGNTSTICVYIKQFYMHACQLKWCILNEIDIFLEFIW